MSLTRTIRGHLYMPKAACLLGGAWASVRARNEYPCSFVPFSDVLGMKGKFRKLCSAGNGDTMLCREDTEDHLGDP